MTIFLLKLLSPHSCPIPEAFMLAQRFKALSSRLALLTAFSVLVGCTRQVVRVVPASPEVPRELTKTTHPTYVIEPPDILQIDLIAATPKPPFRVKPLDVLSVSVRGTNAELPPIGGAYTVAPDGRITFGEPYGSISVVGMTTDEATAAVEKLLTATLKKPGANVTLLQTRATQQIRGPHLVRADGTVGLGTYGQVQVVGMTVPEAKLAIEKELGAVFQDPEVSVEVVGYNSKLYYIVFDYGGAGQQIIPQPSTGNETVLDAISKTAGLPTVADQQGIWVARPAPAGSARQVLPVDWKAVVEGADTSTNYQILPGDRVFVKAYDLVATDNKLARIIAPVERIFGIVLLGSSTVNSIRTDPNLLLGLGR